MKIEAAHGQDGVHLVSIGSLQVVAVHPVIFLHVADHRFDGASPSEPVPLARFHAAPAAVWQVDGGSADLFRIALVPFIAVGVLGIPANHPGHLLERPLEGMPVEEIVV